jgi:hypothetical protein
VTLRRALALPAAPASLAAATLALASLAAAGLVGSASADRIATSPETAAIVRAYGPTPASCLRIRVSTASGDYALAAPASVKPASCPTTTLGVAILKLHGARWRVVYRAPAVTAIRCPISGISSRVVGDLIVEEYPALPCSLPLNHPT